MQVEIKLDPGALAGIGRAAREAAQETVGLLRTEVITAQVMPFDTGTMQDNHHTYVDRQQEDGDSFHTLLMTDSPQSRRLYHHPEYNFQQGKNANAGGEWLKPWLPGGDKETFVPETFRQTLQRRLDK